MSTKKRILNIPSLKIISTLMGFVVVLMGIGFLIIAFLIRPELSALLKGTFMPRFSSTNAAGLLVLGLIGTTNVPYNLFWGSGISSQKQSVKEQQLFCH